MAMGDQPGDPHYEAELAKALNEAKSKGLPDSWTVKLDLKRKKRKWIAPNGRSCESIPKAIAMSVDLGLLPPETIVPTRTKKRPASPTPTPTATPSAAPYKKQAMSEDHADESRDSDPEDSLSPRITSDTRPTTVHWDPYSEQGRKVGWKCRVWDGKHWREGRALLYDTHTRTHKIQFEGTTLLEGVDSERSVWLRLEAETVQFATRLVWAHVKGFAWWPAMVMEGDALEGVKEKKGHVLVAFIGSDDVATLRDSAECLRDFVKGKTDPVIVKHKKKRNSTAIATACQEQDTVQLVRNRACRYYAEKAFGFANKQGLNVLGKRVQLFRDDVNYPYGDTLVGKVRQYSAFSKKWLVSYEISDKTKNKYEASWVNLNQKEHDYKVLEKGKKPHEPTDEDVVPYLCGFVISTPTNGTDEDEPVGSDALMSRLLTERCRGCVDYIKDNQQLVTCKECQGRFHVGCVDPSTTYKGQTVVKANSPDWTCYKCTTCDGCWQHDITYGAHTHVAPKSVTTRDGGDSVNLCTMCVTAYDAERFCPACAHTWNDVHYQKVKRQLKAESKRNKGCKRKRTDLYEAMEELEMDRTDPVEASWYNPDSPVWGYTAGTMLGCDGCNLWVHAGCGGLSQDEYDKTSSGKHDIYCTEFLCRGCCKRRTQEIIDKLEQEDKMYLFAIPVTEQMAPTYHDIIKNPMDLQTMAKRAKRAEDLNYAWVRENFELMVLNALTFNPFHSKVWNEAKRYYHDCMKEVFSVIGKGAPPGIYAKLVLEAFRQADLEKKKEEQRLEQDENTEKKDLVAGAQVANVTLPPMRDPLDQQSCISFQEVKLKPLEAHFGSWMECCFTCGSSGAMDTMLFCVDCGEAFHSFCAGVPIHSMHPSSVSGWRCPNCKVCEISGEVPQDETKMLFCEMCDRAFMCDLLDPPLSCAPPGLWVCGQCVDCKTCGNSSEAKGASLKHWSRDPQKCYRCGGCKGLVKEQTKIAKCVVCSCIWRKDDDDVAKCSTCAGRVHSDCDPVAEEFLLQRSLSSGRGGGTKKYCCPLCRRKEIHQPVLPGDLRKYVQESVWSAVLESDLAQPDSEFSIVEVYEKLTDSIDWRLREMSRQEYTTLIKEAVQMLGVIDQRKISSFDLVTACKTYRIDLPLWMAQRAARFMQSNKCCMVGKLQGDMTELPIESLVAIAKMAAAFLKVSCRALGLPSKKAVETYARMTALLIPPDECGMVGNPIDLVVVDGSFELIQNEEWSRDLEPQVLEAAKADPVLAGLFKSRAQKVVQNRKAPVDSFSYQTASPVCGWNRHIDPDDEENRWADPRACCLCRTCGDDDADGSVAPTADSLIIPHVGRLLPMSHGHWVHTSCALWSSEVYEAPGGGTINAMEKARSRGSQLKCFGCNRSGATVGCFKTNCSRNFHFPCAKACGGVFTVKQQMFCSEHQDSATDILERESIEQMKTLIIAEEKKVGVDKEPGDPNENLSCSRVGALVVQTLGEIEQKIDGFHNERYIMPNGYCATRIFWSGRTPKSRTVYICKIEMSANGNAVFVIIPGDDPSAIIRSKSVVEAYSLLTQRVAKANEGFFNGREIMHSKLPAIRGSTKKAFGLNGPQFFGFGLHHIRKILESLPGIEAVVAPLNEASPSYRFSYFQPSKDVIMDLQRKRAAVQAEKALENSSGSARTEGIKAMTRSGGSGRITRALVRSAVGEDDRPALGKQTDAEAKADRESNQVKYAALKAVPLTQRLAARRSHIHGWGLFTKVDIKKDGMIIEYMGEVVRQCIADKREKGYETLGIGSCYMFRLDLQRIVDATMIGCMARFMNHCCKNNAYAKVIGVDATMGMPADKKIVVFANRDINAGEEITYDYKFPVEDGSLRCTCGAPNCIGRMN